LGFLRRKFDAKPGSRAARAKVADRKAATHRVTLDLARAQAFAVMLAKSRKAQAIEAPDLLAGMYICNWDRLSLYWQEEDRDEIESFLRGICRISPERWHAWIEMYDGLRHPGESWSILKPFGKREKAPALDSEPRPSGALEAILKRAEEIAPSRDSSGGQSVPILTSECVLLCIVRSFGSELTRKLAITGLDAQRLERDALFPRRPPLS